jgi:RNA polymerase sigma factor (sigma-70 family)
VEVSLDEASLVELGKPADLVQLDEALNKLAKLDPRKVQVIELRFFGGLSVKETAVVLQISDRTVLREWNLAKAWLYREICS